jgi:hypothetical protein
MGGAWVPGDAYEVKTRTLDSLSEVYGPFEDAVLWVDIEGSELDALCGAFNLLKKVRLINLEAYAHIQLPLINELLTYHGFMLRKVWNIGIVAGRDAQDYIYENTRTF